MRPIDSVVMTFTEFQCHPLILDFLKCDFSYSCAAADKISTDISHSPSLCETSVAELLERLRRAYE